MIIDNPIVILLVPWLPIIAPILLSILFGFGGVLFMTNTSPLKSRFGFGFLIGALISFAVGSYAILFGDGTFFGGQRFSVLLVVHTFIVYIGLSFTKQTKVYNGK